MEKLIEVAFPLKQTSLDAVHEKNVRHGHISTLHIWPARRPLAAARAALLAALLDAPQDADERDALTLKIGGKLKREREGDPASEVTVGGVLRWCGDAERARKEQASVALAEMRGEILRQYGDKAPKVLDLFAGGGAIPLEALRLGCNVTAVDYNPVAWFLLKCTLDYPQRLAGKRFLLPKTFGSSGADASDGDIAGMMPVQGALDYTAQPSLGDARASGASSVAGEPLAAHVRYWGKWVLERARQDLSDYYPTMPLPVLKEGNKPEELPCPTVAYLWARTIPHRDPAKNGLRVPLLKTLWLCKKAGKKRALRLHYNMAENRFDFEIFAPKNDAEVGQGTMRRNGVFCPPTDSDMGEVFHESAYVQACGKRGELGAVCTAVVVDLPRRGNTAPILHLDTDTCWRPASNRPTLTPKIDMSGESILVPRTGGKEYRLPAAEETEAALAATMALPTLEAELPNGLPNEPISPPDSRAIFVQLYGMDTWRKLFTDRQLLALGTFVKHTRAAREAMAEAYSDVPVANQETLIEALEAYLAIGIDKCADYNSTICAWDANGEYMTHVFMRFALPMKWDFAEVAITYDTTGAFPGAIDWISRVVENITESVAGAGVQVLRQSAVESLGENVYDAIVTDPPYYDAIPYADLSDFFYVWLRRTVGDLYPEQFASELTPKPGEIVQHNGRAVSVSEAKSLYEQGMAAAFKTACRALKPDGCMVIVFAHKKPDAWETLVTAMIKAGFVITASWPIDTEMGNRTRAQNSAALASSVWMVCRKRAADAGDGLYSQALKQMRARITERLDYFWDQGVRGADFLWAAIGPGLEAYSAYDAVYRNDDSPYTVAEFLKTVRQEATAYALDRVLRQASGSDRASQKSDVSGMDELTRYCLMHRNSFGDLPAPVGECILLAGAYGLDLQTLTGQRGVLRRGTAPRVSESHGEDEDDAEASTGASSGGSALRLLRFDERTHPDLGEPRPDGRTALWDQIHRLCREYDTGELSNYRDYRDRFALRENELLWKVAQAMAELTGRDSREKSVLEGVLREKNNGAGRIAPVDTTGNIFEGNHG